jgi:hypothetical protein
MGTKHPNHCRIKQHFTYSLKELATICDVHINTVRSWIRVGLATIDNSRPILVKGAVAKAFLIQKRVRAKNPCSLGQIYCVACRTPQNPLENMVDIVWCSSTLGWLKALCPVCERIMSRRISARTIEPLLKFFDIQITHANPRL